MCIPGVLPCGILAVLPNPWYIPGYARSKGSVVANSVETRKTRKSSFVYKQCVAGISRTIEVVSLER